MTDAVPDIEFLKRELEERDRTIYRLKRELEYADGDRPKDVARVLPHRLPGWHRADWLEFVYLILRRLFETRL